MVDWDEWKRRLFLSIPWQKKKPRERLLCGRGLPHYAAWLLGEWKIFDNWNLIATVTSINYWEVIIYQQQKEQVMRHFMTTTTLYIWRKNSRAFDILCNVGSRSFGWSATSSKNLKGNLYLACAAAGLVNHYTDVYNCLRRRLFISEQ